MENKISMNEVDVLMVEDSPNDAELIAHALSKLNIANKIFWIYWILGIISCLEGNNSAHKEGHNCNNAGICQNCWNQSRFRGIFWRYFIVDFGRSYSRHITAN